MWKQIKDYKKQYRDAFAKLKDSKIELANNQRQIDIIKEQLLTSFEEWYTQEFEQPDAFMENAFNQSMQNEFKPASKSGDTDQNAVDED